MELRQEIEALKSELQLLRSQLASYEEDFKCERVDRTRAVEERLRIEQEFNDYKNASVAQFMQLNKRFEDLSLQLIEKDEVFKQFEMHLKEVLKAALEENERLKKENSKLNKELHTCNKQRMLYHKECATVKRSSLAHDSKASSTEEVMKEAVSKLCIRLNAKELELEAAKEEIAVKVAQVKQYQKQVEAYKQQLAQIQQPAEVKTPGYKSTSSSETLHTDPFLRRQAKSSCDGDYMLKPSSTPSQNAASNCVADGGSEEDDSDDDLPPPMFYKPFQPMYHPAVAHGKQKEDIPLSQLEASKLSFACHQMEHTNGNLPTSTVVNLAGEIDGDISHVAAAIQRETGYRAFEETYSSVPLDPNLKCPKCGKVFKKGRIQKYKHHVLIC